MRKYLLSFSLLASIVALNSCKKDKDDNTIPVYTVPTTYNFENVNYSNQTKLIAMADQIVVAINVANTIPATAIDAQKLKDMFNNTNSYFNDSALSLNASGVKLSDYCNATQKADMMNAFDSISLYSKSSATASAGVAGTAASSANPSKKLLLSPTGLFYSQIVKKMIMGIFAYQITSIYLADSIASSVNNDTKVTGYGTAMEHHWDVAFGFFGVPTGFPTTTTGSKYYGSYSNQVDPGLHSNASLMNAFLKGRAAISAKDMTTKQAQVTIILNTFDKLAAACVVQEMKETDANIDANDMVAAYGTLGETIGFIRCLKYNTSSSRIITSAQISELEALLDSANPSNPNLYNFISSGMTIPAMKAKTDAIRQKIGTIYGFDATTLSLL